MENNTMNNVCYSELNNFTQNLIGFDRLMDEVFNLQASDAKYPPYNYIQVDPEHYTVEMAVAGFEPADISIVTKNGILMVKSTTPENKKADPKPTYIHQGIAQRDFHREFKLTEYVSVVSAEFHNGILSINLEYKLPEHLKEHSVEITSN